MTVSFFLAILFLVLCFVVWVVILTEEKRIRKLKVWEVKSVEFGSVIAITLFLIASVMFFNNAYNP